MSFPEEQLEPRTVKTIIYETSPGVFAELTAAEYLELQKRKISQERREIGSVALKAKQPDFQVETFRHNLQRR